MHARIASIIGHPVSGELLLDGRRLVAAPWGRVCLERSTEEQVRPLVARLERRADLVLRRVTPLDAAPGVQLGGLFALELRLAALTQPYVLQLGTPALFELLERRFWLAPGVLADLAGALAGGLHRLAPAGGDQGAAYARLAKLDDLWAELVALARAASEGRAPSDEQLQVLIRQVARATRLLPWELSKRLALRWLPPRSGLPLELDAALPVLVCALSESNGRVAQQHLHRQNPQHESGPRLERVVHDAMELKQSYPPPEHVCLITQAPSVGRFLDAFPRYRPPSARRRLRR